MYQTTAVAIKKIYFVPYWVAQAIQRNNLGLDVLLDYRKVKDILSPRDLAFVLAANKPDFVCRLLNELNNNQAPETHSLIYLWTSSQPGGNGNSGQGVLTSTIEPLAEHVETQLALNNRIFVEHDDALLQGGMWNKFEQPFVIYDLTATDVFVVINPGHFTTIGMSSHDPLAADVLSKKLASEVLGVFHKYLSIHDVASTSWYSNYLRLLARSVKV